MGSGYTTAQSSADWVESAGSTIVWTDQSREQDDADPYAVWRMSSEDIRTGVRRMLGSSHGRRLPWVPVPRARRACQGVDVAVWPAFEPHSRLESIAVARLPFGRPRAVVRHVTAAEASVTAGHVIYDSGAFQHRHIYSKALRGGRAVRLDVGHADAATPRAAASMAEWAEPSINDPTSERGV